MAASQDPTPPASVRRSVVTFAVGIGGGLLAQLAWVSLASRVLSPTELGQVLTAQALYALLQIGVDNGAGIHGARLAASGALDSRRRAGVVRARVGLALGGVGAIGVFGLAGGTGFAAAVLPFCPALVLFAATNMWEPYGLGKARPMAAYQTARGLAPASAACTCVVIGEPLPVVLVGVMEMLAIAAVALVFHLRPWHHLAMARTGGESNWRAIWTIGAPALTSQLALYAGTLALGIGGSPSAAALVAVGTRIVTGLNAVVGVIATAVFPRLVSEMGGSPAGFARMLRLSVSLQLASAITAAIGTALAAPLLGVVLLDSSAAVASNVIALSAAAVPATSGAVLLGYALVALHRESQALAASAIGTAVTVTGTGIVVASQSSAKAELAVGSLIIGSLLTISLLARLVARAAPASAKPAYLCALGAVSCASALVFSAAVSAIAVPLVLAVALLGLISAVGAGRQGAVKELRRLRRRG